VERRGVGVCRKPGVVAGGRVSGERARNGAAGSPGGLNEVAVSHKISRVGDRLVVNSLRGVRGLLVATLHTAPMETKTFDDLRISGVTFSQ